ncbi:MAG: FecR family protein [Bacteroidia bacterium]|nr:FecR family protein [Bacteroidia bacterium]
MPQDLIDFEILIVNYLDNTITPQEKIQLTEWVNSSKENKDYFLEMARVWEKSTIAMQDKTIAKKHIDKFFAHTKKKKRQTLFQWTIGSAAAIFLFLLGMQLLQPGMLFTNGMTTVVAENIKKQIILPDSSIVWLNAESTLKYPTTFNRSRNVILTGEAYFDIRKNEDNPFEVRTKNITIEVTGTTFLVTDKEDTPFTETVLESGKINLTINSSGEKTSMAPNQQLIYNRENKTTSLQTVDAADYTSWRKKSLVFENIQLKNVFTQLEKWYNIDIVCNNNKLLNIPVSFTLDSESIEDILDILQHVTSFEWAKNTNNTIIIK